MDILIIADFYGNIEAKNDNSRFAYLANMLIKDGHNVEVITSDFYHGKKAYFTKKPSDIANLKITMLHEPSYKKNICLKRFYSHYIFGMNVSKYLKSRKKPDVIYCAVPPLTAAYEAARYCEKNKIRFIIDVQDLWPEAFRMVFNVPILSSLIFFPFKLLANNIYKRADAICAVSETYCNRALRVNKKCKEGTVVYLGTDLDKFDEYAKEEPILKKGENEIWLAYCGTLGASYDLKCVFDTLRTLNDDRIKFIVMGDGPDKEELVEYSKGLNVVFTGMLDYKQMCSQLCECDIAVNPINSRSVATIINKHADYAAAGKPILNTQKTEEYQNLIEKFNMGYNCYSCKDLTSSLKVLLQDESKRYTMENNARSFAENNFNRKYTYSKLISCVVTNGE